MLPRHNTIYQTSFLERGKEAADLTIRLTIRLQLRKKTWNKRVQEPAAVYRLLLGLEAEHKDTKVIFFPKSQVLFALSSVDGIFS